MSLLESFGAGLQSAGEVLSPQVYEKNAIERREQAANALPNLMRSLQIHKIKGELDADQAWQEYAKDKVTPGMDSSAMLGILKDRPDLLSKSPAAQQYFQLAGQLQQREAAQEARQQQIRLAYERLDQQRELAEQRAADARLSAEERARANLANEQLRTQMLRIHEEAQRQGLDLRRELAGQRAGAERERRERMEGGLLTPQESRFMAGQYLAGDSSVFQNIGRGAQGSENIVRLRRAVHELATERGMKPEAIAAKMAEFQGIKAGERTLGTRSANIELAVTEAQNIMPIALAASEKVDRTKYPSINAVLQAAQKGTGDENVVRLASATNALINVYSRAISPTGTPTVSDKDHAREIIDKAYSKGQYKAVVDLMKQEMEAARKSPEQVRQSLREAVTGGSEGGGGTDPLGIRGR